MSRGGQSPLLKVPELVRVALWISLKDKVLLFYRQQFLPPGLWRADLGSSARSACHWGLFSDPRSKKTDKSWQAIQHSFVILQVVVSVSVPPAVSSHKGNARLCLPFQPIVSHSACDLEFRVKDRGSSEEGIGTSVRHSPCLTLGSVWLSSAQCFVLYW